MSIIRLGTGIVKLVFAETANDRAKGLAGYSSMPDALPEDMGLLLVYPERLTPTLWMRGVSFPLDMIFVDGNIIVDIFENVPPLDLTPRTGPVCNYVIEVNGGFCKRYNVNIGDVI